MSRENKKTVLFCVFMSTITTSLLISAKITTLYSLTFTVGAFAYAITFVITDAISEVFGKDEANKLIYIGWLSYGVVVVFSQIAMVLPSADFWQPNQAAYETVLGIVPRIILGSLCSYTVSQYHDIWAFHFWKKVTGNKYLWVRNNASTITSQFIDTLIFITIAFYGIVPNDILYKMIVSQFLIKLIIAVVDTPVVYILVAWLKRERDNGSLEGVVHEQ